MKAVILAGGSGTRLWPMSRKNKPKQFFDVVSEKTLLRETFDRLIPAFSAGDIYVSTSPLFIELVREALPELTEEQVIVEPEKRDTGPAMGYVAAYLERIDPDEPMVFVPSDHFIAQNDLFLRCLVTGGEIVKETGKLVDIGIAPTFPSTALGYTKIDELVRVEDDISFYQFAGHKEKPEFEVAKAYLADGRYLWHANYYMWTPRKFMEAFDRYAPEMGELFRSIQKALDTHDLQEVARLYNQLPKISVDYAIAEKLDHDQMLVIKGDFGWSDIGTWDTLHDRLSEGGRNVTKGACILLETSGSLVYGLREKTVAVVGMKDVIVVDTEDALLVCSKDAAPRVKQLVQEIEERHNDSVL